MKVNVSLNEYDFDKLSFIIILAMTKMIYFI